MLGYIAPVTHAKFIRNLRVILAAFSMAASTALAGGGPQNVLVVVNDNSLESLELGHYYQAKRGVPDRNICHITTTTNYSIDTAGYSNQIRAPVLSYISSAGLSNQIDAIVFSKDIPYRVYQGPYTNYRHSSLPSSMFYGFRSSPDVYTIGCELAAGSASDYYNAERSFVRAGSPSSNRYYLASMLAATNLAGARTMIDRAVAADCSNPTGTVYYYRTLDPRNFQWGEFENSLFMVRLLNGNVRGVELDGYTFENPPKTDVVGLVAGQCCSLNAGANTYLPGAFAEHATSYGGVLYDESEFQQPAREQERILRWTEAGCAGSFGTVVEPCAYTSKFPRAQLHYWYGRGFSLGESLYMSVQNPYQGVAVGDLLCSPYAVPFSVVVSGLSVGQVAAGSVSITVTGTASSASRPLNQLDLYLDGIYVSTLTNQASTRSNVVSVAINGTNCTYRVPLNAQLFNIATGLTASINASNLGVRASAYNDRVEIRQMAPNQPAASWTFAAGSSTGSASTLTTFAATPETNFIESPNFAWEVLTLGGAPVSGDVVRVVVTNLDNATFTNEVTARSTNDTPYSLLTNLAATVNADPGLTNSRGCVLKWVMDGEGYLVARTNGWEGGGLFVSYSVITQPGSTLTGPDFTDQFNDNSNMVTARATVFLSEGRTKLTASYSLDTTVLADGPHELMVVAYEGTAVRTQGRVTIPFVVDNHSVACAITNPPACGTALLSGSITAHVQASAATSVEFYVEGKLLASTNALPYVFLFAATNYGVGQVTLQAKAFASGGDSVLSTNVILVILPDYDFDGLDDNWEIRNWGSITVTDGTNDWDNDSINNHDEYTADTQPTNESSFFRVSRIGWTNNQAQIEYASSTARQYRLHYSDESLLEDLWLPSSSWLWGGDGITTQLDDGTVMPLPTNATRFYRVRAHRP